MDIRGLQIDGSRGGSIVVLAKAHTDIAQGVPVHFKMNQYGYLTQAITNVAGMVGVASKAIASGEVGEFIIEGVGYVLLTAAGATAGYGLIPDVSDNKFKSSGGAMTGIVHREALTHVAVALETVVGAGLCKALINGLDCTCVA